MSKYRILKNKDHCLIQKKGWFFWRYLFNIWHNGTSWKLFNWDSNRYDTVIQAERDILRCKEIERENKKKSSKYEIIYPKVDSKLYNVLNEVDED
jgi:hypothetical protein